MADHDAKRAGKAPPAGLSWTSGGPTKPSKPETPSPLANELDVRGLFGRVSAPPPSPPPPAGGRHRHLHSRPLTDPEIDTVSSLFRASGPVQVPPSPIFVPDPVDEGDQRELAASLFGAERAERAPQADEPLPSIEPRRAHEGTRTSLFDDSVQDPAPAPQVARQPVSPARAAPEAQARTEPAVAGVAPERSSPAPAVARISLETRSVPPAAPPPTPSEAIRVKNASSTGHSAVRPESVQTRDYGDEPIPLPDKPAERARAAPQPAAPPKRARRRRAMSSRDRLMLWALGLASVVALSSAAVLLGLIPGPFGQAPAVTPAPEAPASAAPTPSPAGPPPKPAAAVVASPQPAKPAATASQVVQPSAPAAQPAAAVPVPAPGAPQAPIAPKAGGAEPEAAKPQATKPEAAKAEASKPGAGATAAGQPANPPEDEGGGGGQAALAAARKKLADDDPQGAETLLRQVLAKDPQDHHAMELLAHALMDQDRGAEALPYARKIVQRRPRRVSYRLLLGDLLLMVGDAAAARAEWLEASKIAPGDPQIKRRLAQ